MIGCMGCFFVFKQKTAYEVRISDWSSDVCSSDLLVVRVFAVIQHVDTGLQAGLAAADRPRVRIDSATVGMGGIDRHLDFLERHRRDRKSVVSGKSVSVRVDLGGRRILTKKSKKNQQLMHTTPTHHEKQTPK